MLRCKHLLYRILAGHVRCGATHGPLQGLSLLTHAHSILSCGFQRQGSENRLTSVMFFRMGFQLRLILLS